MDEIEHNDGLHNSYLSSSNSSVDQFLNSLRNKKSGNNIATQSTPSKSEHNSSVSFPATQSNSKNSTNNEINNIMQFEYEEEELNEKQINRKILKSFEAIKPKKKKRRKNSRNYNTNISKSLFDPEKYQNKNPSSMPQHEKWIVPPIKKSKNEINEMVSRLSKPPQRTNVQIPEQFSPKKTTSNPEIFNRLYEMSTEKERKNQEKRDQYEKERKETNSSPKSNSRSQILAENYLLKFVEKCFNSFPKDSVMNNENKSTENKPIANEENKSVANEENKLAESKENKHVKSKGNKNVKSNESEPAENNESNEIEQDLDSYNNNEYYFKQEISQNELDDLLISLGLRSKSDNMPKFNRILFEKMNDWVLKEKQDGSRTYDAYKIHSEMIHVIKEGEFSFSSFDRFARQRIIIALSNLKQNKSQDTTVISSVNNTTLNEGENKSFQSNTKAKYSSLIRLSQSKRNNMEPDTKGNESYLDKFSIKPRPKFQMNPYSEELEPASISAKTEKIFRESEVGWISFIERDQFFTQKRKKMIEKMSEESNKSQLIKFENKPKFTKKVKDELDEYRKKKKEMENCPSDDNPAYRPKVMKYTKFKNTIGREMTEKKVRPKGWESDIARHRIAYQKRLQSKAAKETNDEPEFDMMNDLDIVSKYKL